MKLDGLEVVRGDGVRSAFGTSGEEPADGLFYNGKMVEIGDEGIFNLDYSNNVGESKLSYRQFNGGILIWPEGNIAAMSVRYKREDTKEEGKGRIPIFNIPDFADFLYPHKYGPVAMSRSGEFEVLELDGYYSIQQNRRRDGGLKSFHPSGDIYSYNDDNGGLARVGLDTNGNKWTIDRNSDLSYNREHDYLIGSEGMFGYPGAVKANHSDYELNGSWFPDGQGAVYDGCSDATGDKRYNDVGDGDPCVFYRGTDLFTPPGGTVRSEVAYTNKIALVSVGEGDDDPIIRSYKIENGSPYTTKSQYSSSDNWQGLRGARGDFVLTRNRGDDTLGWLDVGSTSYSAFTSYSNSTARTTIPPNNALVVEDGVMNIYNTYGEIVQTVSMDGKPPVEGEPTPVEGRSVENPAGWGINIS